MRGGFSAALLLGGRSRRMGQDKAFLMFGDPPQYLWLRQLGLLQGLGADQVMISHHTDQVIEAPEGVCLVRDEHDDCGPLGGLVACLRRAENRRLLVLGVDLPQMTETFLKSLLVGERGMVLRDPLHDRFEAVVAVYSPECLLMAEQRLCRGELAMQGLIRECVDRGWLATRDIQEGERELLRNVNRPEDL